MTLYLTTAAWIPITRPSCSFPQSEVEWSEVTTRRPKKLLSPTQVTLKNVKLRHSIWSFARARGQLTTYSQQDLAPKFRHCGRAM